MLLAVLAYIDPGSGALLWQAVLSAFFGGVFLARRTIWRVVTGVRQALDGRRDKAETPDSPSGDAPKRA